MAERIRGRQHPDEPIAPPPCDLLSLEFPAGQSSSERVKAILDWAGFGPAEEPATAETCGFRITDVDGAPVFVCNSPPHPEAPHLHVMLDGHLGFDECTQELRRGTHWAEG